MRGCSGCPGRVPAVSRSLAHKIAARLHDDERPGIINRCAQWLTEQHPGLGVYLGVYGRPYFSDERVWIATEEWAVAQTRCPFAVNGGCALRGLGNYAQVNREMVKREFHWLPTALLRCLDPGLLGYLTRNRLVADAKVAGLSRRSGFPLPRYSTNQPYTDSSLPATQTREVNDDGSLVQARAH